MKQLPAWDTIIFTAIILIYNLVTTKYKSISMLTGLQGVQILENLEKI